MSWVSPNHGPRRGGIVDMLVLHYTGMPDALSALRRLCDPDSQVSAHYLVEEDGTVHALVPESERAWHAGLSSWRGEADVNSRSVGVELVNPGHEFGYRPFPEAQMEALAALCLGILGRHPIPPRNVVGHSDVAPSRKADPGELFDWERLAAAGIGLWPGAPADAPPPEDWPALLAAYGYETSDPRAAILAFQRHFRPSRIDGEMDAGTAARLLRLTDETAFRATRL